MKELVETLIKLIQSTGEVWIENCQMKPIFNFEEEIWVERLYLDPTRKYVMVQYREVDQVNAPRFCDKIESVFTPNQTKDLIELAKNQPEFSVDIKGSGTKADIIKGLERLLNEVKRSDISDFELETECLYTIIETKLKQKKMKIKARSVEELGYQEQTIELTEDQKNFAVDNELVHYDGTEWRFFIQDLPFIESLKKSIVS